MCRSITYEMLQGIHTPERPSSPAELYITEEEEFTRKNPKVYATIPVTQPFMITSKVHLPLIYKTSVFCSVWILITRWVGGDLAVKVPIHRVVLQK